MYYAMDEIGQDGMQRLLTLVTEAERWAFIEGLAYGMGFTGIHLTPSLYRAFGLSIARMPDAFRAFRLTYHAGGSSVGEAYKNAVETGVSLAKQFGMEDVSIHPPAGQNLNKNERQDADTWLRRHLPGWLFMAEDAGITLTMESHVAGDYFLYRGYPEFTRLTDDFPHLGILLDVSHNGFDGYSTHEIVATFQNRNVRGLHLSDADTARGYPQGTHLPVGEGTLDFESLLRAFGNSPDRYGVLEIKATMRDVALSLQRLEAIGRLICN